MNTTACQLSSDAKTKSSSKAHSRKRVLSAVENRARCGCYAVIGPPVRPGVYRSRAIYDTGCTCSRRLSALCGTQVSISVVYDHKESRRPQSPLRIPSIPSVAGTNLLSASSRFATGILAERLCVGHQSSMFAVRIFFISVTMLLEGGVQGKGGGNWVSDCSVPKSLKSHVSSPSIRVDVRCIRTFLLTAW